MRTRSEIQSLHDHLFSCVTLYYQGHPIEDVPTYVDEWKTMIQLLRWVLDDPEDDSDLN